MKKRTFTISFGPYGGFYFKKGYMLRLCLGWMALTFIPEEIDDILHDADKYRDLKADHSRSWMGMSFEAVAEKWMEAERGLQKFWGLHDSEVNKRSRRDEKIEKLCNGGIENILLPWQEYHPRTFKDMVDTMNKAVHSLL